MSILTSEFIKAETGLKLKFSSYEELYPLFDLLTTHLPARSATEAELAVVEKPKVVKAVKKAKKVSEAEAELLAPADADAAGGTALTLGATDAFRSNKYRLSAIDPSHCMARKIDEANPIVGTRPGDDGANGKVFPEAQCSKKATPGGLLCATCAKKEAEYLADTAKVPKGWYGRLDAPLFHKAFVVGCDWFLSKYPAGIAEAPVSAAAPVKPKKAKKTAGEPKVADEPKVVDESVDEPVAAPVKVKKAKAKTAPEAATETIVESVVESVDEPVAAPVKVKKAKAAPEAATETIVESVDEPVAAPVKVKKAKASVASVAADVSAKDVEWVTFVFNGIPLVRHTKTGNVYQCDRTKHRLEEMVQRDKFEGKWCDGRLDQYGKEDEE